MPRWLLWVVAVYRKLLVSLLARGGEQEEENKRGEKNQKIKIFST
jgi:hypothetical protein